MYKQLVVLHTNVELKFEAYLQHVVGASILSLLERAKQSPDHIQFPPDGELESWIGAVCPLILRGTDQKTIQALEAYAKNANLPQEVLYVGLGPSRGKVESVLVIGPCEEELLEEIISQYSLKEVVSLLEFFED